MKGEDMNIMLLSIASPLLIEVEMCFMVGGDVYG